MSVEFDVTYRKRSRLLVGIDPTRSISENLLTWHFEFRVFCASNRFHMNYYCQKKNSVVRHMLVRISIYKYLWSKQKYIMKKKLNFDYSVDVVIYGEPPVCGTHADTCHRCQVQLFVRIHILLIDSAEGQPSTHRVPGTHDAPLFKLHQFIFFVLCT